MTRRTAQSALSAPTVGRGAARLARGMTLIELLVVIGIIGLLISLLAVAGNSAIYSARVRNTRQLMANLEIALDTFKTEDPLRLVYNRPELATFGPLPPYQLFDYNQGNTSSPTVSYVVEPDYGAWDNAGNGLLSDRLWNDLGNQQRAKRYWVRLGGRQGGKQPNEQDGNDDNRALYAYLAAFSPALLSNLPDWSLKPLNPTKPDLINPGGSGPEPGQPGSTWVNIMGIHDAWGVPIDYMQYVRIAWDVGRARDSTNARFVAGYFVKDRRAAFRSHGLEEEKYKVWLKNRAAAPNPPERWIWSSLLPRPWLPSLANTSGNLVAPPSGRPNGWVRVRAYEGGEPDYGYLPTGDGN